MEVSDQIQAKIEEYKFWIKNFKGMKDLDNRVKEIETILDQGDIHLKCQEHTVISGNINVMLELQKSTYEYLEGLGKFLKYKENTFTEKELGIDKEESHGGGDKKNE